VRKRRPRPALTWLATSVAPVAPERSNQQSTFAGRSAPPAKTSGEEIVIADLPIEESAAVELEPKSLPHRDVDED
jgi:hypothetical protein